MAAHLLQPCHLIDKPSLYHGINARIDAAESEFKTVGTVTQKPISEATVPVTNTCSDYLNTYTVQTFKEILSPDILNFDGAEYKIAPRNRAYYLSVMPELNNTNSRYGYRDEVYILEFTPLAASARLRGTPARRPCA